MGLVIRPGEPKQMQRVYVARNLSEAHIVSGMLNAAGIVKMLRKDRRVRYTDTTWRDAHQSLLATRLRSYDISRVAPATAHLCADAGSIQHAADNVRFGQVARDVHALHAFRFPGTDHERHRQVLSTHTGGARLAIQRISGTCTSFARDDQRARVEPAIETRCRPALRRTRR